MTLKSMRVNALLQLFSSLLWLCGPVSKPPVLRECALLFFFLMEQRIWPPLSLGVARRHLEAVTVNAMTRLPPSRLCLALHMSDCGTGHFIEFDDPLQLKWRSGSLRAKEILHRQQGNHKEITVPADFIVSLKYTNQGSKELYRLKIYISEAVAVVNDVQPAHWYIDRNKAPTITPL